MRRVVVTGMGLLTSLGNNKDISWSNLIEIWPDSKFTREDGIKNGDNFFGSLLFIVKDPS